MRRHKSFNPMIADLCYNPIFEALATFIEENPEKLDNHSYCVKNPDEASLEDYAIKTISVKESRDDEILFDVTVLAEVFPGEQTEVELIGTANMTLLETLELKNIMLIKLPEQHIFEMYIKNKKLDIGTYIPFFDEYDILKLIYFSKMINKR